LCVAFFPFRLRERRAGFSVGVCSGFELLPVRFVVLGSEQAAPDVIVCRQAVPLVCIDPEKAERK
jgi:hypothetical protein